MLQRTAPLLLALAALGACAPPAAAPSPTAPGGRAVAEVPVPDAYRAALARGTRSTSGAPGPRYWQQSVSYRIEAELDPSTTRLRGSERILYRNHSPDTLGSVVLNLYQNVFGGAPSNRQPPRTGGVRLGRVAAGGTVLQRRPAREIPVTREPAPGTAPGYAVDGTLARLALPRPLLPGDSLLLEVAWEHDVPPRGAFRTAWEDTLGGRAFQVAQWYPQVAMYDDLRGWDVMPYLGNGEFYLSYGDFEVALTLPAGWLVGATGELQNPEAVLTGEARRRLALAAGSDSVVHVDTREERGAGRATRGAEGERLTWRFRAERVRDFAFAASNRYVWDAVRARVPAGEGETGPGRTALVHALYRPGAAWWGQAARYGQHATEFFSRWLLPYPYPQITVAEGFVGGMEYPMLVFIGKPRRPEPLYEVIAHEIGHEWFPMLVGQDEAAHAWMDEGLTTYIEALAVADFLRPTDPFEGSRDAYLSVAGSSREVPLMVHTDSAPASGARIVAAYMKPGVLLNSLRAVLGDTVFRRAMATYAREWSFRHPTPWDFFRTMERVSGRELGWFFHPWWWTRQTLDHAIEAVEPTAGGVRVVVRDRGSAPAPTPIVATTAGGQTIRAEISVERWLQGARTAEAFLATPEPVIRVELDPERLFPDVERRNGVWEGR